jgi:hypothetical protein
MKYLGNVYRLIMGIDFFQSVSENLLNKCEGIISDATDQQGRYLDMEQATGKGEPS